jgi:hypothetical protein
MAPGATRLARLYSQRPGPSKKGSLANLLRNLHLPGSAFAYPLNAYHYSVTPYTYRSLPDPIRPRCLHPPQVLVVNPYS